MTSQTVKAGNRFGVQSEQRASREREVGSTALSGAGVDVVNVDEMSFINHKGAFVCKTM